VRLGLVEVQSMDAGDCGCGEGAWKTSGRRRGQVKEWPGVVSDPQPNSSAGAVAGAATVASRTCTHLNTVNGPAFALETRAGGQFGDCSVCAQAARERLLLMGCWVLRCDGATVRDWRCSWHAPSVCSARGRWRARGGRDPG
jgi:hypothetical protein